MLRGKGFLVLDASWVDREHEVDTMEDAKEEAARLWVASRGVARVIVYAPIALVQPKLSDDAEFKLTEIGKAAAAIPAQTGKGTTGE